MRLFTGIAIGSEIVERLKQGTASLRAPNLRWSPPQNLHITLKFIGEWPQARLPDLESALGAIDPPAAFDVQVAGFGFLARALYAGIEPAPRLVALAKRIEEALEPLGCPCEKRAYAPHITLARIASGGTLHETISSMGNPSLGSLHVPAFHLYLSTPGPRGSVYSILASYPLA